MAMDHLDNITRIIHIFEQIKLENKKCGEMYCSTCGGYGYAIEKRIGIDKNIRLTIEDTLSKITLDELNIFGKWKSVLLRIDRSGFFPVYIREAKKINLSDIRAIDRFLLDSRTISNMGGDIEFSILYLPILEKGISLALKNADYSLIETLIIVLQDSTVNHPELLKLAIKISENNIQMQRVLYNCLRNVVPEVRGYVGNGNTVYPY